MLCFGVFRAQSNTLGQKSFVICKFLCSEIKSKFFVFWGFFFFGFFFGHSSCFSDPHCSIWLPFIKKKKINLSIPPMKLPGRRINLITVFSYQWRRVSAYYYLL